MNTCFSLSSGRESLPSLSRLKTFTQGAIANCGAQSQRAEVLNKRIASF